VSEIFFKIKPMCHPGSSRRELAGIYCAQLFQADPGQALRAFRDDIRDGVAVAVKTPAAE
jgi:hypothetical protein